MHRGDKLFSALVCVHIPPCQCFEISRKHYKEFCDCFGFSANALTRNWRLPEVREWAKRWLHLYYLLISFLLYVFLDFLLPPDNQNSVFWGKNVVWDIQTLVSRIFCWISVICKSQKYSCRKFSKKNKKKTVQTKSVWALIHTHTHTHTQSQREFDW